LGVYRGRVRAWRAGLRFRAWFYCHGVR
jgi:hypothetical protein